MYMSHPTVTFDSVPQSSRRIYHQKIVCNSLLISKLSSPECLTREQELILTLIRAADGFVTISWSATHATLRLTSMRYAEGLSDCVLELSPLHLMKRKKGDLIGFSFHHRQWQKCCGKDPFQASRAVQVNYQF